MGNKRTSHVIAAMKTILLFFNHPDYIFPYLGDIIGSPNMGEDAVKSTSGFGVVEFQQFGGQRVWPGRVPVRHTPDYVCHLVESEFISKR